MQHLRQFLAILIAVLLLVLSIVAIRHELREYSPQEILSSLAAIPTPRKLAAVCLTALGYLCMTGYDFLSFRYIRRRLPTRQIAFTSFLSYAVGNTIGFTALSGTAIRYRYYSGRLSAIDIAKVVIFTHLSFWLGMFAIGSVVFIVDPLTIPSLLKLPFQSVRPIGWLFLLGIVVYGLLSVSLKQPLRIGDKTLALPSLPLSGLVIALSMLDWAIAAAVLYILFPAGISLPYFSFFGIYMLAMTAGIISTVPGGLGVFETVILLLRPPNVPASDILGALLAFRAIYFFLPCLVAVMLLIVYKLRQQHR